MVYSSDEVVQLVNIVRGLSRQDDLNLPPTKKTIDKLRISLEELLGDLREYRKDVLRAITGIPFPSQINMNQHMHSVFIDLMRSENAEIFRAIAAECKRRSETQDIYLAQNLYSRTGLLSIMSDLQDSGEDGGSSRGADYEGDGIWT